MIKNNFLRKSCAQYHSKLMMMGQKLPENEMELYRRIDEVIHYIWDPIGVYDAPTARDEYYSYLPKIFQLVKGGKSEDKIAEYLDTIQSERMGLPSNIEKCKKAAFIIMNWSDLLGCRK